MSSDIHSRQGPFTAHSESHEQGRVLKLWFTRTDQSVSGLQWRDVLRLWQQSDEFRAVFTEALARVPYPAFFWETPPLSTAESCRTFECAIVNSPQLATESADPNAFAEYIHSGKDSNAIAVFPNLGGDAQLVVPCQNGPPDHYTHIASFLRSAPKPQIYALWETLGRTVEQTLQESSQPLWISTSGLGVSWLHVRLDSEPKYYAYAAYKVLS